jgi:hypothetical protein
MLTGHLGDDGAYGCMQCGLFRGTLGKTEPLIFHGLREVANANVQHLGNGRSNLLLGLQPLDVKYFGLTIGF